jgi:hypothetical protein
VVGGRRGASESATAPVRLESRKSEKMKNGGNEAKKWLKTKDITFFSVANYARFACKFAQIGR